MNKTEIMQNENVIIHVDNQVVIFLQVHSFLVYESQVIDNQLQLIL